MKKIINFSQKSRVFIFFTPLLLVFSFLFFIGINTMLAQVGITPGDPGGDPCINCANRPVIGHVCDHYIDDIEGYNNCMRECQTRGGDCNKYGPCNKWVPADPLPGICQPEPPVLCDDGTLPPCPQTPDRASLQVVKPSTNTGTGRVYSSPGYDIDCGVDCRWSTESSVGDAWGITLYAEPDAGSIFSEWIVVPSITTPSRRTKAANCNTASLETCSVTVRDTTNMTVQAVFSEIPTPPTPKKLTVNKQGSGTGSVTSTPQGINCPSGCSSDSETYEHDTRVTLKATPDIQNIFNSWNGCSSVDPQDKTICEVYMNQARTVRATFTKPPAADAASIAVTKLGTGTGLVRDRNNSGLHCGSTCNLTLTTSSSITWPLEATADLGSRFDRWSIPATTYQNCTRYFFGFCMEWKSIPICGTNSECHVEVPRGSSRTVSATFTSLCDTDPNHPECDCDINPSLPSCPEDPGEDSPLPPAPVEITATKGSGNAIKGTLTSNPAGINCGTDCTSRSASFAYNNPVTLTATPNTGDMYLFNNWTGSSCDSNNNGTCRINNLTTNRTYTANFYGPYEILRPGAGVVGLDANGNPMTTTYNIRPEAPDSANIKDYSCDFPAASPPSSTNKFTFTCIHTTTGDKNIRATITHNGSSVTPTMVSKIEWATPTIEGFRPDPDWIRRDTDGVDGSGESILRWRVRNATSCRLTGGGVDESFNYRMDTLYNDESQRVTGISSTTVYTLTCTNPDNVSTTATTRLNVLPVYQEF